MHSSNKEQQDNFKGDSIAEAIILAGGLGTRLRSVVSDVPKCMAPINGIPFIDFIISYLKKEGITRLILSLGYKAEIIISHIDKTIKGLDIEYVIEETPLGTGGAIQLASRKVKGADVLILNGDTLFNSKLDNIIKAHFLRNADFTAALKEMTNFNRYGSVELGTDQRLLAFHEKRFCEKGLINGGVYVLKTKALFEEDLPESFSFEKDFLEANIHRKKFYGVPDDGYFIDIGIPEDYERFINDHKLIMSKSNEGADIKNPINYQFFRSLDQLA